MAIAQSAGGEKQMARLLITRLQTRVRFRSLLLSSDSLDPIHQV